MTNEQQRIDVLDPQTNIDDVIFGVRGLKSAENRLNLLGRVGVDGILNQMARDGVKPDIGVFKILLSSIPSNRDAEEQLLATMARCHVTPNLVFWHKLLLKRAVRKDDEGAREAGIRPNMFVCQNLLTNCFLSFAYKTLICDKMKQFRILPDRKFIARMEKSLETAERIISDQKYKLGLEQHPNTEDFKKSYLRFRSYFKSWLRTMPLAKA